MQVERNGFHGGTGGMGGKGDSIADDLDFDMGSEGGGDVLEETTNLESTFYNQGYASGFDHGRLHGIFEGRELGREKAWELWEEVGYYEGWAGFWVRMYGGQAGQARQSVEQVGKSGRKGKKERIVSHAKVLLDLISSFPRTNPSSTSTSATVTTSLTSISPTDPSNPSDSAATDPSPNPGTSIDLAALISSIRARYKLLCSSLGVRPRLAGATIVQSTPASGSGSETASSAAQTATPSSGVVPGIEGPMKGVDTRQLRF